MAETASAGMPVAIYYRMSSDKQEDSIPRQRDDLRPFAAARGYRVAREYEEEGIPGYDTPNRRAWTRLCEDAKAGLFRRVLAWDQSRISRADLLGTLRLFEPLMRADVDLEFFHGGLLPLDEMDHQVMFAVKQMAPVEYVKALSRATQSGAMRAMRENGSVIRRHPFGYRREAKRWIIVPEDAAVVRELFRRYRDEDAGLPTLAKWLNTTGIPPRRASAWSHNAVYKILRNRAYTGRLVWGERRLGKHYVCTPRGVVPRRGSETAEPFVHVDESLRIVDDALFEGVQRAFQRRRKATGRDRDNVYLLTGLIRCGNCDAAMRGETSHGTSRRNYNCGRHAHSGNAVCARNTVREDVVLAIVLDHLAAPVGDGRMAALAAARKAAEASSAVDPRERERVEREIADLDRQIKAGAARLLSIDAELLDDFQEALKASRARRDALRAAVAEIDAASAARRSPAPSRVAATVASLRAAMASPDADDPEARRRIRAEIAKIVQRIDCFFSARDAGTRKRSTLERVVIHLLPEGLVGDGGRGAGGADRGGPNMTDRRRSDYRSPLSLPNANTTQQEVAFVIDVRIPHQGLAKRA